MKKIFFLFALLIAWPPTAQSFELNVGEIPDSNRAWTRVILDAAPPVLKSRARKACAPADVAYIFESHNLTSPRAYCGALRIRYAIRCLELPKVKN